MTFNCAQCGTSYEGMNMEEIIDHNYGHTPVDNFGLTRVKAQALYKFLMENGYISYEFHPLVHEIVKDLEKYLGE